MKRILATVFLGTCLTFVCGAQVYDFQDQVNSYNFHSLGMNLANDGWFSFIPSLNQDNDYTNGIDISFGGLLSNHFVNQVLDRIIGDQFYQKSYFVDVSQKMYTPEDKTSMLLIPDDRPYVGYINLGFYLNGKRVNSNDQVVHIDWVGMVSDLKNFFALEFITTKPKEEIVYESLGVQFGVVGDGGAPWAQGLVHGLAKIDESRGWQNHVDSQLTYQLSYNSTQRTRLLGLLDYPVDRSWYNVAVYARHTAELGNAFIRLTQGLNVKFGWFQNEPLSTNSDDTLPTSLRYSSEAKPELFFSPLSINANVIYNVYDATISTANQSKFKIVSVPVILNANYGSDTRFPFGKNAFLYLKLIWLETTTSSFAKYRSDGSVNYDDWLKTKQIVKLGFDYSF